MWLSSPSAEARTFSVAATESEGEAGTPTESSRSSFCERTNEMTLLVFLLLLPILWQLPRTFWPLHLDSTATRFTGLYRRYSIDTFTGHVSNVQTSADTQTIGSVTAQARRAWSLAVPTRGQPPSRTIAGPSRSITPSSFSRIRAERSGQIDAANVKPAIGNGHLVSAAWLVHNGKRGNAFLPSTTTQPTACISSRPDAGRRTRRAAWPKWSSDCPCLPGPMAADRDLASHHPHRSGR